MPKIRCPQCDTLNPQNVDICNVCCSVLPSPHLIANTEPAANDPSADPSTLKKAEPSEVKTEQKIAETEKPNGTPPANDNVPRKKSKHWHIILSVFLLITGSMLFVIFVNAPWTIKQWVLGITGGITLFFASCIVVAILNLILPDSETLESILLTALIIANFVLCLKFGADYTIIFRCLSVWGILISLTLSFATRSKKQRAVSLIDMLLTTALLLINIFLIQK